MSPAKINAGDEPSRGSTDGDERASRRLSRPQPNSRAAVHEINCDFLHLLKSASEEPSHQRCSPCLLEHAPLWSQVDEDTIGWMARSPIILFDFHLNDASWWREEVHLGRFARSEKHRSIFDPGSPLLHAIALHLRLLARQQVSGLCHALGLKDATAREIARLSPAALDRIVREHAAGVRPRFECEDAFWRKLLSAALARDELMLADVHRYGLQFLGGERIRESDG